MARSKSDDKRGSILSSAIAIFADRGLGAPTSAISKTAGVAEGTLFTYFPTKDDLLNALYRDLKMELAEALMAGFARKKDARAKLQHVWDSYINWGVANPERRKVLNQLMVSGKLTEETKAIGSAPFAGIEALGRESISQGVVRDLPKELIAAMMEAATQATMDLMIANPSKAPDYRRLGFEMFWRGLTR